MNFYKHKDKSNEVYLYYFTFPYVKEDKQKSV